MGISDNLSLPVPLGGNSTITGYTQLAVQLALADQDYAAISSMTGDTIVPGSSQAARYNQSLVKEIEEQKNLISTFSNLAATVPGASGWATWDINYLQNLITQEVQKFTSDGGTYSDLVDALYSTTVSDGDRNAFLGAAASGSNSTIQNIDDPVSENAILGSGNTATGSWLTVLGVSNTVMGFDNGAVGSFNLVAGGKFDDAYGNSNTISGAYDDIFGNNDRAIGSDIAIYGSGLTASTGQIVFGNTSSYTVINADGTWSTVVNSQTVSAGSSAFAENANGYLDTPIGSQLEAARESAGQSAKASFYGLGSQYAAFGPSFAATFSSMLLPLAGTIDETQLPW